MTKFRLPGGGPWKVLEECPSRLHNSLRSARAHVRGHGMDQEKCICPRSLQILAEWREKNDSLERQKERAKRMRGMRLRPRSPELISSERPDFSNGVCTRPEAIKGAEAGMNEETSVSGIRARERAKALCDAGPCPVRSECRAWVLGNERPAGSWGGVYGGLDPWNRQGRQLVIINRKVQAIPFDIQQVDK